MFRKIKEKIFNTPSLRITFRYYSIALVFLIIVSLLLPTILNYGPESINTPFDVEMSFIAYYQQFILISLVVFIALYLLSKFLLRDIDKWYKLPDEKKYSDLSLIKKVRKKCFNLPYIVFLLELLIPPCITAALLFATGSHQPIMIIKILVLVISALLILSVCSFIFAKNIYADILSKTYSSDGNLGYRVDLWKKIILQTIPLVVMCILITALISYSGSVREIEDIYYNVYSKILHTSFDTNKEYSLDEIKNIIHSIELYDTNKHSIFVINNNNSLTTIKGPKVSEFVKQYTIQISDKYNGRTYDSYGIDAQGSTLKLKTEAGTIYVGVLFNVESVITLHYLIIVFISLLVLATVVLVLFGKSISNDLLQIVDGFKKITSKDDTLVNKLPVISNDEIGDLVSAFNHIQTQQNQYVQTIKNNQDTLMEKERLASLGQLIGGISHNLKTPIMSISGAAEGLTDLINEYDESIGDPDVTNDDHHAIANDMRDWITKIHSYTSYMSDIITAVKGQAVNLSENESDVFTIDEMIKRVTILMKHEIRNASLTLNTQINIPSTTTLHGDVNSLVQVVNNLITNAIQSYNGKKDDTIDLSVNTDENNVVISVADHGCGMTKEVQNKLFKSMITTKGKNGTGLGMFMSYSTIKGHFNGDITFETEVNKGTTFNIILPLK